MITYVKPHLREHAIVLHVSGSHQMPRDPPEIVKKQSRSCQIDLKVKQNEVLLRQQRFKVSL